MPKRWQQEEKMSKPYTLVVMEKGITLLCPVLKNQNGKERIKMVIKMTLKDLNESDTIKYANTKFGNPPLEVGNIVWVRVFDDNGIFEIPIKIIEAIEKQTCLRCGYSFFPKSEKLPATCPNRECKSPYWNKPRTKGV